MPPYEARQFCDWLFAGGPANLSHVAFSVLALGDRSYTHFCKCGRSIDEAMEKVRVWEREAHRGAKRWEGGGAGRAKAFMSASK